MWTKQTRKLVISGIILIWVLCTIVYVWQEPFNIRARINHDKVGSYFTIVAALITALSILMLISQTAIMRKQNLPNLIIGGVLIRLKGVKDGPNFRYKYLADSPLEYVDYVPQYKVSNHGKGVANNVAIGWKFSGDAFAEEKKYQEKVKAFLKENDTVEPYIPSLFLKYLENITTEVIEKTLAESEPELKWANVGVFVFFQDDDGEKHRKEFKVAISPSTNTPISRAEFDVNFHHVATISISNIL
jgi:hypothetical protein